MTTLTERIRNGSGEDRKLERDICIHFGLRLQWDDGRPNVPLLSDLNAVFVLVERELYPVETISLRGKPGKEQWASIERYGRQCDALGPDRCRALLLALLAAKEQRT